YESGRVAFGNSHCFRVANVRQTNKTNSRRLACDGIGERGAILETTGRRREVGTSEHQSSKRIESAGLVVARKNLNRAARTVQLRPVIDLARKYPGHLLLS